MARSALTQGDQFSLLWPNDAAALAAPAADPAAADDLRIKVIADAIAPHIDYLAPIRNLLSSMITDEVTLHATGRTRSRIACGSPILQTAWRRCCR